MIKQKCNYILIKILNLMLAASIALGGFWTDALPVRAAYSPLKLTILYSAQIRLNWEDNIAGESGYIIERKVDSGSFAEIARVPANFTSYIDSSLASGRVYTYRVRWVDSSGTSYEYTNEVSTTTTALAAPASLAVTPVASTRIDLSWSYPESKNYETAIERKEAGGAWQQVAVVDKGITAYSDTNLKPNTLYYYRIMAVSGTFVRSSTYPDNDLGIGTYALLEPPTGLHGYALDTPQIMLFWEDCPYETSYTIERRPANSDEFAVVGYVPADTTFWRDWGTSPNARYVYRIRASTSVNTSSYSEEAGITATYLEAPGDFAVEAVSRSEINLNWTDNSSKETGFEIWRRVEGSTRWEKYASVGRNVKSYADRDIDSGKQYYYRVRAVVAHSDIYSSFTNDSGARAMDIKAPDNLQYGIISTSQIKLAWKDRSNNETGFKIERKNGMDGTWTEIAALGPGITQYVSSGLAPHTQYFYRVKAFNKLYSCASYSEEIEVFIGDLPQAPSNVTSKALSATEVMLEWKDKSYNELGFIIERRESTGRIFKEIARVDTNTQSYLDRVLNPKTEYCYRIRSYNKMGKSTFSGLTYVTTKQGKNFSDIEEGHWAQNAIQSMVTRGVMPAVESKFMPDKKVTRGEFASFMVKAFNIDRVGVGAFADVNPRTEHYREIMILKGLGVIVGDKSNRYYPDRVLSRQDMAVILVRTLKTLEKPLKGYEDSILDKYDDAESISPYAVSSIASLVGEGIINERISYGNILLAPRSGVTRAEAAWVLYNVLGKIKS